MSSILDIDLDYFNLIPDPVAQLENLLSWAGRPVDMMVEKHHHVLRRWTGRVRRGTLTPPEFILHADEHHDMMDERRTPNIANMMYHAMTRWPDCRVCWVVHDRIDDPGQWLGDDTWDRLRQRFSIVRQRPARWPKPDLVSVCTSPEFIESGLIKQLTGTLERHRTQGE
jgi:hypothetical protein